MSIHPVDVALVVIYFAVVVLIGWRASRHTAGSVDYFLAGRGLGWTLIGLSLFASNISSTTLIGLGGAGYSSGVAISVYEWMAAPVLVFFAVFVIPAYLNNRIYTVPEYLERRFRPACRWYFSGLTVFGNIFIDTAGTLFAGALVVQLFYPSVPLWVAGGVLALIAGLYTAAGGLRAVVYTDALQAVVLLSGACLITWLALDAVGGWQRMIAQTPPEMLSVVRPVDDRTMPWTGMLIGVPILGFYFWCTNQFVVQRVLGARSIADARRGALFAGLLKLPVLFIMVVPGIIALQLYPDLERADLVFPTLIAELLPVGIRGLVLAALLAAIMSSLDSTLNSVSTLVTMDFVKRLRPQTGEATLVRFGRMSTVVVMLFSAAWVPVVASSESLFEYLQSSLAYLFPPVVAIVLLGLFWSRANGNGALAGLIGGHFVALTTFLLVQVEIVQMHFLHLTGVFLFASLAITAIVSLLTEPRASDPRLRWSPADAGDPHARSWLGDYRWQSIGLLVLTLWLVWAFS